MSKISKSPEGGRDEARIMAEYLAREVHKVLAGQTYTKERPFKIEMHRPLNTAPHLKEFLVIFSEKPGSYTLTKGSQFSRGSEIEGFQISLSQKDGHWQFDDPNLDYYNYGFGIFAFLKTVNEGGSTSQPSESPKQIE